MLATSHLDRTRLQRVLRKLSEEQITEVLTFALFLKKRSSRKNSRDLMSDVQTSPVSSLGKLAGLVAWGGDAVEDAERLYD